MSNIEGAPYPEDVWYEAKQAMARVGWHANSMIIGAAEAILAERERCAKVAEHLNGWGDDHGKGGHAEHIAACIRKPDSRGYDIGAPEAEDAA